MDLLSVLVRPGLVLREKLSPFLVFHVAFETCLALLVAYLFVQKAYAPRQQRRGATPGRAPSRLVLKDRSDDLTEEEIDALCEEWIPEPLVPPSTESVLLSPRNGTSAEATTSLVRTSVSVALGSSELADTDTSDLREALTVHAYEPGGYCLVQVGDYGMKRCMNLASANYAGLQRDPRIEHACREVLLKYGCGACGPRGFYGTLDVHLRCEYEIAKFMGTHEAILYSFGPATSTSIVNAFAKKGDIIFADECVHYPLQNGMQLSRATIVWFHHNDPTDLERKVVAIESMQRKTRAENHRQFIIVEGIFQNTGTIARLDEIVAIKHRHRNLRLFVDESHALGVLGVTGRGACEHFGLQLGPDVDIIAADLAFSLGTIGGFCVGAELATVDHQRLSSAGYCFSASQPPCLAEAAIIGLQILREEPGRLQRIRTNAARFRRALREHLPSSVVVEGNLDESPLIHLRLQTQSVRLLLSRVMHLVQATERQLRNRADRLRSVESNGENENGDSTDTDSSVSAEETEDMGVLVTDAAMRQINHASAVAAAATAHEMIMPGMYQAGAFEELVTERFWAIARERLARQDVWASVPGQLLTEHMRLPPALVLHVSASHEPTELDRAAKTIGKLLDGMLGAVKHER
ncbi:Serine palmitoyl-transferase [Cyanidiococcus yangmingshanensis]|uniref:serine C-palmitoyltransferase n=1 Tax=Cyanidiococcus yangmingshanensis TaxID=2690220 RepID=A0A7J7IID0_9RHOD|nr:Serine palmitoyl-transferase [Cyanidiococcus yangmingshanensis]